MLYTEPCLGLARRSLDFPGGAFYVTVALSLAEVVHASEGYGGPYGSGGAGADWEGELGGPPPNIEALSPEKAEYFTR